MHLLRAKIRKNKVIVEPTAKCLLQLALISLSCPYVCGINSDLGLGLKDWTEDSYLRNTCTFQEDFDDIIAVGIKSWDWELRKGRKFE